MSPKLEWVRVHTYILSITDRVPIFRAFFIPKKQLNCHQIDSARTGDASSEIATPKAIIQTRFTGGKADRCSRGRLISIKNGVFSYPSPRALGSIKTPSGLDIIVRNLPIVVIVVCPAWVCLCTGKVLRYVSKNCTGALKVWWHVSKTSFL